MREPYVRFSALLWRQVRMTLSYLGPNLVKLAHPAGYLLLSVGLGGSVGTLLYRGRELAYIDFLLPGLLAMLAFDAFGATLFRASNEKQWGIFRQTALRGVRPGEYLASHLLYGLLWYLFRALLMVAAAVLLGARPALSGLLPCLLWGCSGTLLWTAAGLAVGIRIDSYHTRDTLSTLVSLPVAFASSAFYDVTRAPMVLRAVAAVNPLSLMTDAMRDSLLDLPLHMTNGLLLLLLGLAAMWIAHYFIARTPLVAQDR